MPMRYAEELAAIRADRAALSLANRRLRWSLARTTPEATRRTAAARVEDLKRDSESFRRSRSEHARVQSEIEQEEARARGAAASIARFGVEPLAERLQARYQQFVAARRADCSLSFPQALAGVDPNGMLVFHLLRETLRPIVQQADAATLLRMYSEGMQAKDARGRIVCELAEERVDRGGLARTQDDLVIAKRLSELVEGVRELRVPIEELRGVEEAIDDAGRAIGLADVARVQPANPTHDATAKAAYERDNAAFAAEALAAKAANQ